jgi:hypothetical protein
LISPSLLVTRTADETGLDVVGFVAVGGGAGSVVAPDWKYEHPNAASVTTRIGERII